MHQDPDWKLYQRPTKPQQDEMAPFAKYVEWFMMPHIAITCMSSKLHILRKESNNRIICLHLEST